MNEVRQIPEYLTKCFSSRIKDKIDRALTRAHLEGYSKEQIQQAFDEWLATQEER